MYKIFEKNLILNEYLFLVLKLVVILKYDFVMVEKNFLKVYFV